MANRTPRISHQNALGLGAAIVSASSEHPDFPARWAILPQASKPWRSKLGWNVVAGFNDKIDFYRTTVKVGTLTPGNYATPDLYAAQVQAAMVAGDSGNNYTVTYSTSTKKFTIAGTSTFELRWSSGANAATNCGKDLGFVVTSNDTGSNSYTADNVAYHSREWIKVDCATAQSCQFLASGGHNLLVGTGAATMQANDTDAWTSPANSQVLTVNSRLGAYFLASSWSRRWWRLLIEDVANVEGYSQVAVLWGGAYLEPSRGLLPGYTDGIDDLSGVVQSTTGAIYQDRRGYRRAQSIDFSRLRVTEKNAFDSMMEYLGVGRPFFLSLDPQNYAADSTRYVFLTRPIQFQHQIGDGTPPERWDVRLEVLEAVG